MRGRAKSRPQVPLLGRDSLAAMRRAGRLAAATLDMIGAEVATGVETDRLDTLCHDFIRDHGARPAPLGYQGYPRATCISVGEVVCHGIPGPRRLAEGDIVNIDVTVVLDGWYGDTSRMYWVGATSEAARRLCQVTFEALWRGIRAVRPGATLGDLGHAVQAHAEAHGCSVVRDYCGHGIGRRFHQPPTVLHHGKPGRGMSLEPGMSFTIEPMLNLGGHEVDVLEDGWTVITRDASLSAQFEHTVVVTETGVEVMTLSPEGQHHPPW
ncbi:type I methionyl aminopeptidase [Geminicoccaceae bacterium 1502E]|nr:type I methionyl aminopeptidase [Geminicoccaceae bacterium 1502E]